MFKHTQKKPVSYLCTHRLKGKLRGKIWFTYLKLPTGTFWLSPLSVTLSITSTYKFISVPSLHSSVKRPMERDWNLLYCLICNSHFVAKPVYLLFGWAEVHLRQAVGEITSAEVEEREKNGREEGCEWQTIFRDYYPNTLLLALCPSLCFLFSLALSCFPQHSRFSPAPFSPSVSPTVRLLHQLMFFSLNNMICMWYFSLLDISETSPDTTVFSTHPRIFQLHKNNLLVMADFVVCWCIFLLNVYFSSIFCAAIDFFFLFLVWWCFHPTRASPGPFLCFGDSLCTTLRGGGAVNPTVCPSNMLIPLQRQCTTGFYHCHDSSLHVRVHTDDNKHLKPSIFLYVHKNVPRLFPNTPGIGSCHHMTL